MLLRRGLLWRILIAGIVTRCAHHEKLSACREATILHLARYKNVVGDCPVVLAMRADNVICTVLRGL